MPSTDEDSNGNLSLTWMESSNSEYLTTWVGTINPAGKLVAAIEAAVAGFFFANGRIGDYNTTVLDQSDDRKDVFRSANEYISDGGNTNIWRTNFTSFTAGKHRKHIASYSAQ